MLSSGVDDLILYPIVLQVGKNQENALSLYF